MSGNPDADDESSSDIGGNAGGAMGFFDVVAPTILAEIDQERDRKKSTSMSSSQISVDVSTDVGSGSGDESSGGMETSDAVGLFDALDEGEVEAAVGGTLINVEKLLKKSKGEPWVSKECEMWTQSKSTILGVINYGHGQLITHEMDCIRVWDFGSKKPLLKWPLQVRRMRRYNHWLFCVDADSEDILQIDLRDTELKPNRFTGLEEEATALAINNFVGFGVSLFAITKDALAYSWKCPDVGMQGADLPICTRFKGHTQNVTSLDLGDSFLYTSSCDKSVRVWNYGDGSCFQKLDGHTDWVFSVKVIGKLVYSGSRDETVRIWSDKGECTRVVKLQAIAYGVMLEEGHLYIRDASKRVFVCSGSGDKVLGTAEGSAGNIRHFIVFKKSLITCAENDPTVRVWDAQTGQCLALLKGHTDAVNMIAMFGAGVLLSAGEDGTIRAWDLHSIFKDAAPDSALEETPRSKLRGSMAVERSKLSTSGRRSSFASLMSKPRASTIGQQPRVEPQMRTKSGATLSGVFARRPASMPDPGMSPPPQQSLSPKGTIVTPQQISSFQGTMKGLLKTHKVKGQFYPSTFTGKDLVAWIKGNIEGMDNSKAALQFGVLLYREGAYELVLGKVIAEKSSVLLKLK